MEKSTQGKMVGAAVVLGLSVGIGTDLALAEEAAQITAKSTSTSPQVFKFAVDNKKPGQPTAAKFDGIDGESNDARGKQPTPNNNKVTFEDVLVSSAKGEATPPGDAKGAMDPNAQPRGEKIGAKPRSNAKRMHKP